MSTDGLDWGNPSLHNFLMQKADELLRNPKDDGSATTVTSTPKYTVTPVLSTTSKYTPMHSSTPKYDITPMHTSRSYESSYSPSSYATPDIEKPRFQYQQNEEEWKQVTRSMIDAIHNVKKQGVSLYDMVKTTEPSNSSSEQQHAAVDDYEKFLSFLSESEAKAQQLTIHERDEMQELVSARLLHSSPSSMASSPEFMQRLNKFILDQQQQQQRLIAVNKELLSRLERASMSSPNKSNDFNSEYNSYHAPAAESTWQRPKIERQETSEPTEPLVEAKVPSQNSLQSSILSSPPPQQLQLPPPSIPLIPSNPPQLPQLPQSPPPPPSPKPPTPPMLLPNTNNATQQQQQQTPQPQTSPFASAQPNTKTPTPTPTPNLPTASSIRARKWPPDDKGDNNNNNNNNSNISNTTSARQPPRQWPPPSASSSPKLQQQVPPPTPPSLFRPQSHSPATQPPSTNSNNDNNNNNNNNHDNTNTSNPSNPPASIQALPPLPSQQLAPQAAPPPSQQPQPPPVAPPTPNGSRAALLDIPTALGVHIWRVEYPEVKPWGQVGVFYTGDTYIVIRNGMLQGALQREIYVWAGLFTTPDEVRTAFSVVSGMDEKLGGSAILHREFQDLESTRFLSIFSCGETCAMILEGGYNAQNKNVPKIPAGAPTMLWIKGKGERIRARQVPCNRNSMNSSGIFVLIVETSPKLIMVWNGKQSAVQEQTKALVIAKSKGEVSVVVSESEDAPQFWKYVMGGMGPVGAAIDENLKEGEHVLYVLTETSPAIKFNEVARHTITSAMLDPDDSFILDIGIEIYIWVGLGASLSERQTALVIADAFLKQKNRRFIPTTRILQGREPLYFQNHCLLKEK